MLICPACQASFADTAPAHCPQCGQPLAPRADQETAATLEFVLPDAPPSGEDTAATIELVQAPAQLPGPHDKTIGRGYDPAVTQDLVPSARQVVRVATRKLSMVDTAMVTNAWESAIAANANVRATHKLDSKSSGAKRSSLVVNPRGVRNTHEPQPKRAHTGGGADYELLEVIGTGGMGVVYSARQASVDRLVAVKMIRQKVAGDANQREKFLSEAVVTGDLDHPNIVPIYELGTNEDDALFYSMKRVQGTPWSKVIDQKPLAENLEILMKVADAVAFAHSNGVIHRDLKPDNIMLGDFGEVLVMDWGLALATASFRHGEFVTGPDSMGGTPAYIAPEMATGPFERIGQHSDIYLLGAILFEIITGLTPHHGSTAKECVLAAAQNEIQHTEESGELIDIAYHALATEPADRFASVREFQAAIRDYHAHCESILLAERADEELTQATATKDYQSFAQALFGFKSALALWDGNVRAESAISEVRLAYAKAAKDKGDFELGLSLLDASDPQHTPLYVALGAALAESQARQKWLTRFKRIAAAMVVIVFGVITVALIIIADAKNQETAAKDQAIVDKIAAETAERAAETAKAIAVTAEGKAKQEEALARAAESKAKIAEEDERKQKLIAIAAEDKAKAEEKKAIVAKQGEEYAAYVARIGMTAAKIEENAFDTAQSLLNACLPEDGETDLRNWEWGYLKRLCGHGRNFPANGTVYSVAFSPDQKWFVTAGEDGQAHLWDRATQEHRLAIRHGAAIYSVAVSPDSRYLATAGGDGVVRISNAKDGSAVRSLSGHQDRVLGVAFSPHDGRFLVSCSRDRTARVWDTTTGREIGDSPLRGHSWWVWSAAFSADEKQIVTAGQDGKVIVWSFDARGEGPHVRQHKVFLGHDGPVFAAAFSPDGRQVASAGYDKRVLLWQPEKIQDVDLKDLVAEGPLSAQESRSFEGHSAPVRTVGFSANGEYLLSGGDDNTARIWDTMTGKTRSVLHGHSRPLESCAFSADGRQVLSGGQQGQIKLWSLLDYKELRAPQARVLEGHDDAILAAAFARDGRQIVTASRDHTARVYDAATGQCVRVLKEGHDFLVSRAIYFHDGKWLLTAAGDNSVRIWDAATGAQLSSLEGTGRNAIAAVSRDSKWILTGKSEKKEASSSSQIILWELDAEGRSPRAHVFADRSFGSGHRSTVTAVGISPDSRWLFSGDEAGAGRLWNAATGELSFELKGHTNRITQAFFLPDGNRLLTSSTDGTVAQWDVSTGKELPLAFTHGESGNRDGVQAPIANMDLSPDGRRLLTLAKESSGERHNVIRLWDVARGRLEFELYRGPENVTSMAFASENAAISVGVHPRTDDRPAGRSVVRRWNLETGREVTSKGGKPYLEFTDTQGAVWSALEAPAGSGVLTVGGNGAALWDPRNREKPELTFKPHSGVTSAGISPNGKWIVTGSSDERAKVWNAATGQVEMQLPSAHKGQINSALFSPVDNQLLVTASNDGTARVWELPSRRVLHVLTHRDADGAGGPVRMAVFSPDGRHIATACEDGAVRFWEAATGRAAGAIKLDCPVLAVAYSADGRRIIAGGANGKAMVYDVTSHRPLVRYLGHTAAIHSVALSPDGRRALTGSSDRLAKLWDIDIQDSAPIDAEDPLATVRTADTEEPVDGKEILSLKHHDQAVTSVAFSPDGHSILTASFDGMAVLWIADDWQSPPPKEH